LCRTQRPQLLLTDIILPGMTGVALAKQLRASYPELKVLFMSAYNEEAGVTQEIRARAFVQKPFTPEVLLAHVQAALAQDPAVAVA
jgi:CheY-like chemotaxis protein